MKRPVGQRATHVVLVGIDLRQWQFHHTLLASSLWSAHAGWELTTFGALTVPVAIEHIKRREDVEIVYLSGRIAGRDDLLSDTGAIAAAIVEHEHQPCVVLAPPVAYLSPYFREKRIWVETPDLPAAILNRWASQKSDLRSALPD